MLNKEKKTQLGKGMAALLGDFPTEEKDFLFVSIDSIETNKNQPRKIFSKKELEELSQSIKENGILQPLIVKKRGSRYELIAGERRLRGAILAGLKEVPVILKQVEEEKKLVLSLIENIQRQDLNCLEEAEAYDYLLKQLSLTQEELAQKIGKERSTVTNFLRLLKLPIEVKKFIQEGLLTLGHGKVLLSLNNAEKILFFAKKTIQGSLSVRDLEKLVEKEETVQEKKTKKKHPFEEKFNLYKPKIERKSGVKIDLQMKRGEEGAFLLHFHSQEMFEKMCQILSRMPSV